MYYEVALESRKWQQGWEETTQVFVYELCNEDLSEDDADYGAFFAPNDDVALAKYIYANFPDYRVFTTPGGDIILYLRNISAGEETKNGWKFTIEYGPPHRKQFQENEPTYVQFGFTTNGDSKHLSRSLAVISAVARTGATTLPPETYRLIGASKDTVEGIDISDASLAFNITGFYDTSVWNTSVLTLFTAMTKRMNNATFYGFPAGEVLLDDVQAQGEILKVTPVTFNFLHSPNINGAVDLPFPVLTALGHDYIDYRYVEEAMSDQIVQWPLYRYVHRVREFGNFSLLGI